MQHNANRDIDFRARCVQLKKLPDLPDAKTGAHAKFRKCPPENISVNMKSVALSVWIFINLICFGMCGYFYLIWSQYWMSLERQKFAKAATKQERSRNSEPFYYVENSMGSQKLFKNVTDPYPMQGYNKSNLPIIIGGYNKFLVLKKNNRSKKQINVITKNGGRPRFPNLERSFIEMDSKKHQCEIEKPERCMGKVEEFKSLVLKEFRRILMDEGNILKAITSSNPYSVVYNATKHGNYKEKDTKELLCDLKSKSIRTITALDAPFAALGFGKRIPKLPLLKNNFYNSCAIVASSGALLGSNLGNFIGNHEIFNIKLLDE